MAEGRRNSWKAPTAKIFDLADAKIAGQDLLSSTVSRKGIVTVVILMAAMHERIIWQSRKRFPTIAASEPRFLRTGDHKPLANSVSPQNKCGASSPHAPWKYAT